MNKESKLTRAQSILNQAKLLGLITKDTSELTDDKQIKLANAIVNNAQKAYRNNERGEKVTSILFAADVDMNVSEDDPDEDEVRYRKILEEHIESGLPIPPEIEGTPPDLPLDLTELSDKQVRWLHGAFNACSARVGWLYSVEEGGESAAKQIADHYEEQYITTTDRKDIGGKPKPQALLKAEAKQANSTIVKWRDREKKHSIKANKYKRMFEIYNNNCERLSREWTMRIQQRESEGK